MSKSLKNENSENFHFLTTMSIKEIVEIFLDKLVLEKPEYEKKKLKKIWKECQVKPQKNSDESSGCPYKFTKGKKGGEICGVKSQVSLYCSAHKKFEGKASKEQKIIPVVRKGSNRSSSNKNVLIKHIGIDKYYHPETGMVFKSNEKRVVIGKISGSKMKPLEPDDFEVCLAHGFRVEKEENEEENEEENFSVTSSKIIRKSLGLKEKKLKK